MMMEMTLFVPIERFCEIVAREDKTGLESEGGSGASRKGMEAFDEWML